MKIERDSVRRRVFADEFRLLVVTRRAWDVELFLTQQISGMCISGQAYHACMAWLSRVSWVACDIERSLRYETSSDSCWWQAVRQVSPGIFHRRCRAVIV